MVRTKKHFRPPSSSSSSESSSEEEDDDDVLVDQQMMAQRGRGKQMIFGRGKQLPPSVAVAAPPPPRIEGRGKQLRAPEPEPEDEDDGDESSDDTSSGDDSDDDDDDERASVPHPPASRGKQLARPTTVPAPFVVGRGKQLRAPSSSLPPAAEAAIGPPSGGGPLAASTMSTGRQFGRSMGKQLAMQTVQPAMDDDDDDDSDSSSEEEPWNAAPPAVLQQRGMGKQLRLPLPPDAADKKESDMEESSEDEEDEDINDEKEVKSPPPPAAAKKTTAPPNKKRAQRSKPEEESEESEFEPEAKKKKAPPPKRGKGRPPARAAATRAARSTQAVAKKEISSEEEEEEPEEDDDDEEEEEESDDEISDDSSDEEQEWDMETFDTQKLVQGAEDKKYLESLPELERENILAERFEKLKSEADMKKAIRENKRKEREKKKPAGAKKKKPVAKRTAPVRGGKKAPPAKKKRSVRKKTESDDDEDTDDEDNEETPDTSADVLLAQSLAGKRVSARNLDKKGKQFKKQAALARIRESRATKQNLADEESESDLDYGRDSDDSDDDYEESTMLKPWQQQKGKKKQQPESSDDESVGADDDDDRQAPKGSMETRTEDTEAVLEDYYKVSLPRRRLMRWCNEPFFEKAVKNFYVRLGIGRDNITQKPCYRLCKITGVVIKSEYKFPPDLYQKTISTNKWLKVSFGKTLREFNMLTVSDHRPSLDDVGKLVTQLKAERLTDHILTKKSANKLRKHQDELVINYTYTKEDVDMLVSEKKKRNSKPSNIGLEKTRIAIAVKAANDEVEDAKKRLEDAEVERMEADDDIAAAAEENVEKAKKELVSAKKKLDERKEEQQRIHKEEEERNSRLKNSSKVQNWVKVNQRAKLANRNADFESYKDQLAREKIQGSAEPKFDPYARRSMKPKNLWEVGGPKTNETSGSSGMIVEEEKKEATERDDTNVGKDGDGENKREDVSEPLKMDLPGQANIFAFDDDIVIGSDIANMGGIGVKSVKVRARKGLSLMEYQERKAAGIL